MHDMPRPRPPHLHRQVTRHGKTVWYVRLTRSGPCVRIRAAYGTPDFDAEYAAAVAGELPARVNKTSAGTLAWLLDRYRETSAWRDLSMATKRQRENIFKGVIEKAGREPYRAISRKTVTDGRDRRSGTPAQARNFLDAVRGLFRWALDADMVKVDPTAGVKNPKRKKGAGFPVWTEDEVDLYQARWPLGTKERVWIDVLLYTGLRRGDAVVVGRQHVREGICTFRTEKSGETVTVTIPILPVLKATLDAGPTGELAYICGRHRKPLIKESFGNMFKEACVEAGVTGKSAHGLRKIGATRAANNGATVSQLEALFGWSGGGMAALYTRSADRARLGKEAAGMLVKNDERTSMHTPDQKVCAAAAKMKHNQ
jgi:integrase